MLLLLHAACPGLALHVWHNTCTHATTACNTLVHIVSRLYSNLPPPSDTPPPECHRLHSHSTPLSRLPLLPPPKVVRR